MLHKLILFFRRLCIVQLNTAKITSCVYAHKLICISLSVGYKEKVMTAEAIQKAALKSQKRKQLADEKREKDKVSAHIPRQSTVKYDLIQ